MDGIRSPDPEFLALVKQRVDTSPFHSWAGIKLLELGDGTADVYVDLQEHHLNPYGIVHGGMIASLADAAIGIAMRTRLDPAFVHVTAQLDLHYLGMVKAGRVIGRGRTVHLGSKMGYGEADIEDADGTLIARASATFIVLPPRDESPSPSGMPTD